MTESVASASHASDATFSLAVWYGTVGGSALALDPDPNVTPPLPGRILRYTAKRDGVLLMGGLAPTQFALAPSLKCAIADGTSLSAQAWYYDDSLARWIKIGAVGNFVFAAANVTNPGIQLGNHGGAKIFVQVTANVGVTAFGYDLK